MATAARGGFQRPVIPSSSAGGRAGHQGFALFRKGIAASRQDVMHVVVGKSGAGRVEERIADQRVAFARQHGTGGLAHIGHGLEFILRVMMPRRELPPLCPTTPQTEFGTGRRGDTVHHHAADRDHAVAAGVVHSKNIARSIRGVWRPRRSLPARRQDQDRETSCRAFISGALLIAPASAFRSRDSAPSAHPAGHSSALAPTLRRQIVDRGQVGLPPAFST